MIYEYTWVEADSMLATSPHCRGKECTKAHYRDGKPKVKMTPLKVVPFRKNYLRLIYMCPNCKRVIPSWG